MKQQKAFTLAEVLIALLIIGLVAAMTVPAVMVRLKAREYRVALQKGINSLARAATANYGLDGYDFSGTNGYYGDVNDPIALYNVPGGADDGYDVFGSDSPAISDIETHSDLYLYTNSLFHIWKNNLNLKLSKEVHNYEVLPADITLNCASRPSYTTVLIKNPGSTPVSATLKPDFKSREYWSQSVVQGSGNIAPLCEGRTLEEGGINQGRMFVMEDGMVFTYDPAQAYCLETNPCYGYIDVNGFAPPNRVIACSVGEDSFITSYSKNSLPGMMMGACTVKPEDVTDIYPVLFYNNVVKPASWAGKSVYLQTKSNQLSASGDPNESSGTGE